jgi:putative salt-induced outer membrane protein YdiY
VKVVLKDETALEGTPLATEEGKMMLETAKLEAPAAFSLADVKAINPLPVKPVRINTRVNASVTNERGNTKSDNYYFDGEFVARTEKNRYKIGGELSKEESDGTTTAQNWLAHGNYSHFLSKKWYLYADTLFEHDEFKDLDLRSTLGAGTGYQIFETPLLNLSISAGLAEVDENFDVAEDNDYSAGQWSVNYDQYFFKKIVQLFHVHTGFISLENADDWFLKTRTGLRFPVYKGLTATLQYNFDYDNQPSEDAEKREDTKFIFLLGYEFRN